jgi:hypothetical protein
MAQDIIAEDLISTRRQIFSAPLNPRTADYVNGRFG